MAAQFVQAVQGLSSGPTRHQSLLTLIRFHGTLGLVLQQLLSLYLYVLAEWECPPRQHSPTGYDETLLQCLVPLFRAIC